MPIGQVIYLEGRAVSSEEIQAVLAVLGCTVFLANTVAKAEQLMDRHAIDLVLLSVEQNDKTKIINFALSLKEEDIPIIFLGFNDNRAIYAQAKQANLIAYLVSPIDMLTLTSIVESSLTSRNEVEATDAWHTAQYLEDYLFIKVNQLLQKVSIFNITHIRSEGNYCLIFTNEKKYAIKLSMVRLKHKLANKGLFQVHKSYLVQINKIDSIDISGNLVMIGSLRIPLGRKYKQELLSRLNLL